MEKKRSEDAHTHLVDCARGEDSGKVAIALVRGPGSQPQDLASTSAAFSLGKDWVTLHDIRTKSPVTTEMMPREWSSSN